MSNTSSNKTLTDRVAGGAAWALMGRGMKQVMGFAVSIFLLRHLLPGDYGLVDMALVFVYVATEVRDLRLADALIQRKEVTASHLSSAFCVHAGAGLALSVVLVTCAPLLARMYGEPALGPIAAALGARPFIDSLSDVSRTLLERRMQFKKTALADLGSLVIGGTLGVTLAIKGYGAWALVALTLGCSVATTALLLTWGRWLPVLKFRRERIMELWRFSAYLYGARFLTQFGRNVDKLLVGKFLGSALLGLYARGFSIMTMPLERVVWVVGRVMFVALSGLQDDLERYRRGYLRSVRMISLVVFPIVTGLCITVSEVLAVIARPEWLEAVTIIRIFCIVGFFESVTTSAGWIFFSSGQTKRQFLWTFVTVLVTAVAVVAGLRYGIKGVAIAYLIRTIILMTPTLAMAFRRVELRVITLLRWLAPVATATGIMAAIVITARATLLKVDTLPIWVVLMLEVVCGIIVYVLGIRIIAKQAWNEAVTLLRKFLARD